MTYSSGGLIQAADFNGFAGTTQVGSAATINQIWGIGTGNCGYGQSPIATVSAGGTVAATNWASLINTLNIIRNHQTGSGSGISAPSAGSTVTYLSTLSTQISSAYTARNSYATTGLDITSTKTLTMNATASVASSASATWTVTFGSVDQARYFFNAGGHIFIYYGTFTNIGATARGTSINTLCQTNYLYKVLYANSMSIRQGSGGTVVTDTTGTGYYTLPTGATQYLRINSTSYYSGDYCYLNINTNGGAGSYGANGNIITITFGAYSATTGSTQPSDAINITQNMICYVRRPETSTGLTSSWGTPTIA
jgi:hypothetical protein